jgi:hypothetical protein
MSLDKQCRARCIVGCLLSMIQREHGQRAATYKADDQFTVKVPGKWMGTISRRCSSAEATSSDLAKERWSLAHVHLGNEMVLGVRFHDGAIELIRYKPGRWEEWFGQYDPSDVAEYPLAGS